MRYSILCPSPLVNDKSIKDLCDSYIKRMNGVVELIEVKCKISASESPQSVMEKQGKALLDALSSKQPAYTIVMDERGKIISSPDLANVVEMVALNGQSHICIVIGGAHGLSKDVINQADYNLSFGKMVWPHRLVGAMVLEQLYRAQCISSGHPYHKS